MGVRIYPILPCEKCGVPLRRTHGRSPRFCSPQCSGRAPKLTPFTLADFNERTKPVGDCIEWLGPFAFCGYGRVTLGSRVNGTRRTMPAHRLAYELQIGPIPEGLFVCHHCDNPPCVKLEHLFLGTQLDNMRDMVQKGRQSRKGPPPGQNRGSLHGLAKITEADALRIRARYADGAESQAAIARDYGVEQTTVSLIVRRKTWAHV